MNKEAVGGSGRRRPPACSKAKLASDIHTCHAGVPRNLGVKHTQSAAHENAVLARAIYQALRMSRRACSASPSMQSTAPVPHSDSPST